MSYHIATLAGDGIGPEIVEQAVKALKAIGQKFGHEFKFEYSPVGAAAIDQTGDPFPEETFQNCL
ncbi:MAG: isocitrate/isopropylmalate family dehydrogenase, partial [Bacteroidota bacterium]